jgi:flagellar basal-body rod modification protein FlgD
MQTSLLNNNSNSDGSVNSGANIAGNSAAETKDMFTKLLVAQIKNQDPLSPTDPSQFINQLTQLSQTESLQNLSTLTSANASVLQSMQVLAMGAQVGSDVLVSASSVTLGTAKVGGEITLGNASAKTTLVLTGADGVKHNVSLGTQPAGVVPFAIDPSALGLPPGSYKMSVETSSKDTPTIAVSGRLNSVRMAGSGNVALNVANVGEVTPSDIIAFNGKSPSATQSSL